MSRYFFILIFFKKKFLKFPKDISVFTSIRQRNNTVNAFLQYIRCITRTARLQLPTRGKLHIRSHSLILFCSLEIGRRQVYVRHRRLYTSLYYVHLRPSVTLLLLKPDRFFQRIKTNVFLNHRFAPSAMQDIRVILFSLKGF